MKHHLIHCLGALLAAAAIHTHAQEDVVILPSEPGSAPGGPPPRFERRLAQVVRPAAPPRPHPSHAAASDRIPHPMLILSSSPEEKVVAQIREDMAVMSLILDKNVREVASDASFKAMGIELLTFPGSRPTRNIYIEDYGILFTPRVNMPLLAPENAAPSDAKDQDEPVDTAWEEARGEIFGGPKHGRDESAPTSYDPRSVAQLKKTLLESLRNASNIRNLADSDWVTIVVTGQPAISVARGDFERALRFEFKAVLHWTPDPLDEDASTMVLRARKSDIDQFAKSKDLEAFQEKVTVVLY